MWQTNVINTINKATVSGATPSKMHVSLFQCYLQCFATSIANLQLKNAWPHEAEASFCDFILLFCNVF